MARYKIEYTLKRSKQLHETEPSKFPGIALDPELVSKCRTIVVVRDSEGEDHPDNAGVWLLHRIVK